MTFAIKILGLVSMVMTFAVACGSSESSLCGGPNDPHGIFCDPGVDTIDLLSAEQRARAEVGADARLVLVLASHNRLIDPDGKSDLWRFQYYIPGGNGEPEVRGVVVTANQVVEVGLPVFPPECVPEEGIIPFDSRTLIHDAIGRLEPTDNPVRLGETGNLDMWQLHPCYEWRADMRNAVQYGGFVGTSTVVYDDQGQFQALLEE